MSVLYISYDGMLEPLGQSQVLAYLKRLAADRPIHLISFEKSDDWANVAERERLARDIAASGIVWHPLRYHKRPTALATAWDIVCGIALGLWLVLRHRLRIVHARMHGAMWRRSWRWRSSLHRLIFNRPHWQFCHAVFGKKT